MIRHTASNIRIIRPDGANTVFQNAADTVVREKGEVGLQVAAYLDGRLIVDVHSEIAGAWEPRPPGCSTAESSASK
jgi:hypothetical protein